MGLLARWRRSRLPAEAQRAFETGETVVSWAPDGADGHLIATNRGLWLPGAEERLGWHQIHKATWSGRTLTVLPGRLVTAAGTAPDAPVDVVADDDAAQTTYSLDDPADLPQQIRTRVTRSVAYSTHHELPNGAVRVLARRIPGRDGLTWELRYDPGTVLIGADHELVAELLDEARRLAG